ncbi:MAG: hypothetical protein VKQ33_14415 [Candidatus Sericytochromatia bacterium]|nr:hypothetical protein [Candidatus Sericytochromatia bacterium]
MKHRAAFTLAAGLWGLAVLACGPVPGPGDVVPSVPTPPAPTATPTAVPTPPPLPPDVPRQGTFLFFEDFEQGLARWTIEGGTAQVGWQHLNAYTCGGAWTMLLGTPGRRPFANARGEAVLRLRAPIDLAKARRPYLFFDVRGQTVPEEAVVLQPEVSLDGRAWTPVGEAVRGRFPFVSHHHASLEAFLGKAVQLRFHVAFQVGSTPVLGVLLDDVNVLEPSAPAGE